MNIFAAVAQLVVQGFCKSQVAGSSPVSSFYHKCVAFQLYHVPHVEVAQTRLIFSEIHGIIHV